MQVNGEDIDLEPTVSKDVTGLVNEGVGQSNQGIAQSYTAGNSQARGLLNRTDGFNDQLSYGNSAESAAIRSRANRGYNRSEYQLNTKAMQAADSDHVRKLQMASALAGEEVETNKQKEMLKYKIEQANKRARGAIVGTVLGIVGGAAGAYLGLGAGVGGAAAGAMVGSQLGEGAGNLLGSQ
jgi:hypothetical protein